MELRYRLYSAGQILSLLVGVALAVAAYAGLVGAVAPGLVPTEQRTAVAGGVVALALAGWFVFGRLRVGRWAAIGEQAGLRPDEGGFGSRVRTGIDVPISVDPVPDLVGTVRGRAVRATTYTVSTGASGDEGSTSKSYTVLQAELDDPTDSGIVLGPATDGPGSEMIDLLPGSVETVAVDDQFVAVGTDSEGAARDLLTPESRTALLALEEPTGVYVGDSTDIVMDALPEEMGAVMSLVSGKIEERLRSHPANDAATVSIITQGLLLDPDRIERRLTAAAAVANAAQAGRNGASRL